MNTLKLISGYHKDRGPKRITLKVDIAKAFDSVRWEFVFSCLRGLEVPEQFIRWLLPCITTTSFSVGFNGQLHGFFKGKRGLRQGDPLSTLLFVTAMNTLSLMLDKAALNEIFNYHHKCKEANLTHLCFADNLLIIFMEGSMESMQGVLGVLKEFEQVSGLSVSVEKSCFYSGLTQQESNRISHEIGLQKGSLPFRYLGLPLSSKKLSNLDCAPLIQKIKGRLSTWAAKTLSLAGRLQLLNSVIAGITNFWSTAFILPKRCIKEINSLCGAFLWKGTTDGKHTTKVSWENVTKSKAEGGLGVRNLARWNQAAALKLIWMLFLKSGSVWVAWIKEEVLAGNLSNFWTLKEKHTHTWLINKLIRCRDLIFPWIKIKTGNDQNVKFWTDHWSPLGKLLDYLGEDGPQRLGIPIAARLFDLWSNGSWCLPAARSEQQVLLFSHISTISLTDSPDVYEWWIDDHWKRRENVGVLYTVLAGPVVETQWHQIIWFSGSIPKHRLTSWLFTLNRNPTRYRLRSWGLAVDPGCLLCRGGIESRDHLFYECSFSWIVWSSIANRCNFQPLRQWDTQIHALSALPKANKKRKLILIAWQATTYLLWAERNSRLHRNSFRSPELTVSSIDLLVRNRIASLRSQNSRSASVLLQQWFQRS